MVDRPVRTYRAHRWIAGVSFALVLTAVSASGQQGVPPTAPQARRADLERFRTEFLERDRAYSAENRRLATARLATLERALDTLSRVGLELEIARIVALADNGHTTAIAGPRSRRYYRVPLRLVPFGDQFFVLRADTAHADLLGARLAAIDGRPMAELIEVARTLAGGTTAWRDRSAAFFFESPEQMRALGVTSAAEAATYRFELAGGRAVNRRLVAEPPNGRRDRFPGSRWMYPPDGGADGPWQALLSAEQAPWALRDPGTPFRWRAAPELDGLVIEFRQNRNAPDHPIAAFQGEMTDEIRQRRPRHLVVDMRMNGGGDLNTTRDFFRSLPTLVPGRIFVLTSPWTFSAAISSVGYLKQAGADRVTVVGEMVGDRLEFWAEGSVVELSYTGAALLYATERHDYRTGCRPYPDCHGPVVRNPISVPSLAPEIAAPWTIEAYRAGRDPAMEAVAAALSRGR